MGIIQVWNSIIAAVGFFISGVRLNGRLRLRREFLDGSFGLFCMLTLCRGFRLNKRLGLDDWLRVG